MSDDKTELPTAERIQELREKGVVSYSALSTALVVLLVLLGLYFQDLAIAAKFQAVIIQTQSVADLSKIFTVLQEICSGYLLAPALATLIAILLWGLVQSKFLFKMGLVSIDLSRLMPRCTFAITAILSALSKGIFTFFVALACTALIWSSFAVMILEMLHVHPEQAIVVFFEGIKHKLPLAVITIGFLILALFLVEKLRFALANRMTRKEVQAEQ